MIVYLHGLNSSAASEKARLTVEYCSDNGIDCVAPTMHHRPAQAMAQIIPLIDDGKTHTVIGSSMGGYFVTWLCENYPALRGVLINPAVRLAELLTDYVGTQQSNYNTGDTYLFEQAHLQEFAALTVGKITAPERYLLLAQTGDEVLDYRVAEAFYAGAAQIIEDGGDHSFVDYVRHLPAIAAFAAA